MLRFLPALIFCCCTSHLGWAQSPRVLPLLCHWADTSRCSVNSGGQYWNDVWGTVVHGEEYAIIGSTTGAHVIRLDDCSERAFLQQAPASAVHRDFKTYRGYLYCVSGEGFDARLRTYDLSGLPDTVQEVWSSNPDSVSRALCMFVDTARARLYLGTVTGNTTGTHSIAVYSLARPEAPSFLCYVDDFTLTHGIYVRNDTAWCSNGWGGYAILDMSRLPGVAAIGGLTSYPFMGYNHSNWMGYDGIGVMSDEDFGLPLKMIDTRNPTRIQILSTFSPRGTDSTSIPHNPYLLGHLVFASYYMDGLQVYDVSDPAHPHQVAHYPTWAGQPSQQYAGAWGCYPFLPSHRILVSDMQSGLFVLDARELLRVDAKQQGRLQLFPNPVKDVLQLQFEQPLRDGATLEIVDANGRLCLWRKLAAGQADGGLQLSLPPTFAPGNYVLRVQQGAEVFTARFTKP